jgi:dipeptidyl aminopeptidase/acylaminoacyl peptidase
MSLSGVNPDIEDDSGPGRPDPDPDLDLDLDRVGLVGHSAGGHLALWAAKHAPLPLRVVVSQSGVLDLRSAARDRLDGNADGRLPATVEFVGGEPDDADFDAACALASPIELLPLGPTVHQFVLHGDADNRVPFQQSVDYVAAAQAAGDSVELAAFTGMGHFEVIDAAHESWLRVADELTKRLGA